MVVVVIGVVVMVIIVTGVMVMIIIVTGLTPLKDNCKCPRCLQRNRNIMLRCNALLPCNAANCARPATSRLLR